MPKSKHKHVYKRFNLDSGGTLHVCQPGIAGYGAPCDKPYGGSYWNPAKNSGKGGEEFARGRNGFRLEKEAKDWIRRGVESARNGSVPVVAKAGYVRDELRTWIAGRVTRQDAAKNTLRQYTTCIEKHIIPIIGEKKLGALTRDDVQEMIDTLAQNGVYANTVQQCGTVLGMVCNEAAISERISGSPLIKIKYPKLTKAKRHLPARHEIELQASLMPTDTALAVFIMAGTGLRLGEALSTHKDDVQGGSLRTTDQWTSANELAPMKGREEGDERIIPLPDWLREKIEVHVAEFGTSEDGFLFPGRTMRLMSQATFMDYMKEARKIAKLPRITPHCLRHYFYTVCMSASLPQIDIDIWMGHAAQKLQGTYYHPTPQAYENGRTALDTAWSSAAEEHTEEDAA